MTPANRRVSRAPPLPDEEPFEPIAPPLAASAGREGSGLRSALRAGLGIALVAGASVGVAWAARRHVTQSPRFAVRRFDVSGNERRPADVIVAESGVAMGVNVFSLDLDAARARIVSDAWIADCSLTRRLPGTIVVRVTERTPAALVAIGETFLATADGEVFKPLDPGDPVDLPLITGLTPESVADDREEGRTTIRRGIDLASEYEHSPLARRAPLEEVHVNAGGGFTLIVGRTAMELVIGGPPFRRKLDEAARTMGELDRRRAKAQAIIVDNDARPERVVVRLR